MKQAKKIALKQKFENVKLQFKVKFIKMFGGVNWKRRFKNKTFLVAITSTIITLLIALGLPLPANSETIATSVLTLLTLGGVLNDSTTQSLFNDIDAEELKASKLARATEKSEMRCSKYIRKQNEKLAKKAMKKKIKI